MDGRRRWRHNGRHQGSRGLWHTPTPPPCPRCLSPDTRSFSHSYLSQSQFRYLCYSCMYSWIQGGRLRTSFRVGGGGPHASNPFVPSGFHPRRSVRRQQAALPRVNNVLYPAIGMTRIISQISSLNLNDDSPWPPNWRVVESDVPSRNFSSNDEAAAGRPRQPNNSPLLPSQPPERLYDQPRPIRPRPFIIINGEQLPVRLEDFVAPPVHRPPLPTVNDQPPESMEDPMLIEGIGRDAVHDRDKGKQPMNPSDEDVAARTVGTGTLTYLPCAVAAADKYDWSFLTSNHRNNGDGASTSGSARFIDDAISSSDDSDDDQRRG